MGRVSGPSMCILTTNPRKQKTAMTRRVQTRAKRTRKRIAAETETEKEAMGAIETNRVTTTARAVRPAKISNLYKRNKIIFKFLYLHKLSQTQINIFIQQKEIFYLKLNLESLLNEKLVLNYLRFDILFMMVFIDLVHSARSSMQGFISSFEWTLISKYPVCLSPTKYRSF